MDFAAARKNMLDGQIRPARVDDPLVLGALAGLKRENFVPKPMQGIAYVDDCIPLGGGRFVMRPSVLARMLQEVEPSPDDVVLVIGCGTGYGVAALSRLVSTVVAIESDPGLVERSSRNLVEIGADSAIIIESPMADGYPAQAPFDIIFFSGAVSEIPDSITAQLADGGRLIAVVRDSRPGTGRAVLIRRIDGAFARSDVFEANLAFLPGFGPRDAFVF